MGKILETQDLKLFLQKEVDPVLIIGKINM
jgi:hypothetical protein